MFKTKPQGVLCDISGVLKNGDGNKDIAINGSLDAFKRLKDSNLPFLLCTNESLYTVDEISEKLAKIGFDVGSNQILSPLSYMIQVIKDNDIKPYTLAKPSILKALGHHESDSNAVIVGDAEELFTYENMNKVFRLLIAGDKKFYCLGKSRYYKEAGQLQLDLGCFVTGLEYSSQTKAEVIGKPSECFFRKAADMLGIPHSQLVMIGDDVESDIGGSMKAGLDGILVRTGKFRLSDAEHPTVRPTYIAANMAEAVDVILHAVETM